MKKYFDRASSTERRFLIGTFLVLFMALNWIFVWPLFSDWSKFNARREKAQRTLKRFEDTIAQTVTLKPKVAALEGEASGVPPEDQQVKFMTTIQSQAAASGILIVNSVSQQARTNQFFLERAQALTVTAGESALVDFLFRLGTGESLVRVRGMSLRPDPPRHGLSGNLTLVASYQKKIPARAATPPPTTSPAPAAKPTTTPAATKPAATPAEKPKSSPTAKTNTTAVPGVPKPSTPTKK